MKWPYFQILIASYKHNLLESFLVIFSSPIVYFHEGTFLLARIKMEKKGVVGGRCTMLTFGVLYFILFSSFLLGIV